MNTVIVTKPIQVKGDFVIVSRKEYEALVARPSVKEFTPTAAQKRALARAEKNHKLGKTLSLDEFRKKMGLRR